MVAPTIVALASGRPPAAIAVVRVSGPAAMACVTALTGAPPPAARRLSLRNLVDPRDKSRLDSAMVVVFPGPGSSTGEDVAEFHLHGGIAVVEGVLDALTALPEIRLAEAGDFTRRAFANDRLDLAQVEGLADLVAAETAAQRQQALAQVGGMLTGAVAEWRERCLSILAEAEAVLDFAEDEQDVADRMMVDTTSELRKAAAELETLIADGRRGERLREGLTIVITGPPNVGKSSLINALTARDVAIVTPHAGTTRDAIEVRVDLEGVAAVLIDTAGLRETDDPIEREGIRRATKRAAEADLILHVIDPATPAIPSDGWLVLNKIDIIETAPLPAAGWHVSALRGDGISELRSALATWARSLLRPQEPALLGHLRHRAAFIAAHRAFCDAADSTDTVLQAEHLRSAAHAFGLVSGRVGVEDILDRIFSRFCIGK